MSELHANSGYPLDTLANMIKAHLKKSADQRIAAGKYLIEARNRVAAGEAGDVAWYDWCAEHLLIGQRQVQRLLAEGGDPTKVVAARAANAAHNAAHRARSEEAPTAPHVRRDDPGPETTREDDPYVVLASRPTLTVVPKVEATMEPVDPVRQEWQQLVDLYETVSQDARELFKIYVTRVRDAKGPCPSPLTKRPLAA